MVDQERNDLVNSICRACLSLLLTLLILPSAAVYAGFATRRREPTPPVKFREHLIDHLPGAYQCTVADINGDGKPDIVALSADKNEIAWYENPTWKKHLLTTATHGNIDIAAYDMDGDGKLEMAVASEFDLGNTQTGGRLQWFKPGADVTAEWTGHDIARTPTAHRLRWADWDGNGKKELLVVPILGAGAAAPSYNAPLSIISYAFTNGEAHGRLVDRSLTVAHGMRILDFDGDGRDDLLTASYEGVTLYKPVGKGTARTWQKIPLGAGEQSMPPKRGSSEVDRGWLKPVSGSTKKRPFLATIEPWHGNEVVVYTPPADGKGLWKRQVIDATLEDGHALVCADLDGDGQSEILASYRGGRHNLYYYRCLNADGTQWERSTIDAGGMAGAGIVAADLNGDGRIDLVCTGSATSNVKWYENLGPVLPPAR
jgi:hypothetical protein